MARKGQKSTKAEREAGKRNLGTWLKANPSRGNLKHGAYSTAVRIKYKDKRTRQGRFLHRTISALVEDISPDLTAAQELIIARLAEKLIVLCQLSHFIETQGEKIIDKQGNAIPCLNTQLRYSASLLRDLDLLYKEI